MSWSVSKKIGTVEKVRAAVVPEFDRAAASYAGTPEEQDVLGAKASVLSWLDTAAKVYENEVVSVEASGSRGATWLTVKVDCSKFQLLT